jgi:hypothetical protein
LDIRELEAKVREANPQLNIERVLKLMEERELELKGIKKEQEINPAPIAQVTSFEHQP